MPHQCTECGRTFDDGSKQMLSGCPDCGGNKFQYRPADEDEAPATEEPPEPAVESSVARTVGSAATAVRDLVGSGPATSGSAAEPEPAGEAAVDPEEDAAQASARSEVVPKEQLPPAPETPATTSPESTPDTGAQVTPDGESQVTSDGETEPAPDTPDEGDTRERPDLSQLREELNDQFESIKVLEPGQYELNLMELYDREEYIIALQEDGKYTIQVPERWKDE
jgi:hypothetical protein